MSTDTVGAAQLRAIVERIERLEEEKKTIADDIKDIYAEAKGNGFDTKAIRTIIKLRKMDQAERAEAEAILDVYKAALGMLPLFEAELELHRAVAKAHKVNAPSLASFTINGDEYQRDPETGKIAFLGPHSQEVDDGRPHPSSNDSGAKNDGAQTIAGRADDRSDLSITQLEQQDASVSQDRNEPISDSEATVSHSNTRDPHDLEVDDGQPRTKSPDACGVKCDGSQPIVGHGGVEPTHSSAQSEQSVTHSNTTLATSPEASRKAGEGVLLPLSPAANHDDDVPDFLKRDTAPARKTAADFRPNCRRPDACASSGLHHCYQCEKASQEMEGAAA